jgi:hypothetical protein
VTTVPYKQIIIATGEGQGGAVGLRPPDPHPGTSGLMPA